MNPTATLFERLLGEQFAGLPPAVAALHRQGAPTTWRGEADVERGKNAMTVLIGWFAGLPEAGPAQPLAVTFSAAGAHETWRRDFNGSPFVTRLGEDEGLLTERLWPLSFRFKLQPIATGLAWTFDGTRLLGAPLPSALSPTVMAEEYDDSGVYHFVVDVRLPIVGLLVRYTGWLKPAG